METQQPKYSGTSGDEMLHQHLTYSTVMIVHGDMTCTGDIMTSGTELRDKRRNRQARLSKKNSPHWRT